jgi:hypothetical protein
MPDREGAQKDTRLERCSTESDRPASRGETESWSLSATLQGIAYYVRQTDSLRPQLHDLQAILAAIRDLMLDEDSSEPSIQAIAQLVQQANNKLVDTNALIEYQLSRSSQGDGVVASHNDRKVSKVKWYFEEGKVKGLRDDLRDIRARLAFALSTYTS